MPEINIKKLEDKTFKISEPKPDIHQQEPVEDKQPNEPVPEPDISNKIQINVNHLEDIKEEELLPEEIEEFDELEEIKEFDELPEELPEIKPKRGRRKGKSDVWLCGDPDKSISFDFSSMMPLLGVLAIKYFTT